MFLSGTFAHGASNIEEKLESRLVRRIAMSNESQSSIEEEFESFCRRYGVHSAGEMAAKISGFDWATTPLGPINSWSETLLSAVNMILSAPLPMQLLWGQDFTLIYNDAFMPFLAGKHPKALGRSAAECCFEA